MPQVPEYIKKKRSKELSRITKEIQLENNSKWIGKIVEALVIERNNNRILARTKEYKNIILPNCNISLGEKIEVMIDDVTPFCLIGRITKR